MEIPFFPSNYLPTIQKLLFINDIVGTILGGTVNGLLLYVLYKMDKEEISNYKRILILVTLTDFILSLSNSMTMLSMESYNGYLLTFTQGITFLVPSVIWNYSCIFIHMVLFELSFCNICITFFYRYLLLIHNYKMTNLQFFSIIFCLIIWHSLSLITLGFCVIPKDNPDYQKLIHLFEVSYKNEFIEYGRDVIILNIFLVYGLLFIIHLFSTSSISVIIIYFSYYKIRKQLKSQQNSMSSKSILLQNQLNRVMFCHALVPMFLAFLPIVIFDTLVYFHINIKGLGTILFFTVEWVPFISGLISLTMINACRKKFLAIIRLRNDNSSNVVPMRKYMHRHSNVNISSFAG